MGHLKKAKETLDAEKSRVNSLLNTVEDTAEQL
jgi:hypothetical protein